VQYGVQYVVGTLAKPAKVAGASRMDIVDGPTDIGAVVWVAGADAPVDEFDHAWLVESRVQWDGAQARPGLPVPGVKQVTLLRRAAGIDHEEFTSHWAEVHAPLARIHHPALWRYTQNVVVRPLRDGPFADIDGIAELGMRLRLDFSERMYDSPEGRAVVSADVRRFLNLRAGRMLWTREYPASR
jgi:uncharacterized protein (TIGR02118 family)